MNSGRVVNQNDYYLGMPEDEATVLAYNEGFDTVRILARDGNHFIVTRDFKRGRMNFRVEQSLVTYASVG